MRKITWSQHVAYAVGLLASDGCLGTRNYIDLTSKDLEQIENFRKALKLKSKIGMKKGLNNNISYRTQLRNKVLYDFLTGIGITPAKSKTIGSLSIPDKYFFDFLRGTFDGDGTFYSYWDPRWKSSFMFYTVFISASQKHINWLQSKLYDLLGVKGHITTNKNNACLQLKYGKTESLPILEKMYHKKCDIYLSRKRLKILSVLAMIDKP